MKRVVWLMMPALSALVIALAVSVYAQSGSENMGECFHMMGPYPCLLNENMTQEEKNLRIQMLELEQEATQNRISYLKGEIDQEQFRQKMQEYCNNTQPLMEQMREQMQSGNPGHPPKRGMGGFGHRTRGW